MLQFDEYKVKLNNLRPELDELDQALGLETAIREVEMLESESASDGFWDNLEKAQKVQQRVKQLRDKIEGQQKRKTQWDDLMTLCELGNEAEDETLVPEVEEGFAKLEAEIEEAKLSTLLTGEYDGSNAILTFHAGAGGTEAQDWAQRHALVLAGEQWHQGVVGIVASRLAEKYACPAFMICLQDGKGKGSCRSFAGFNLFAALERCAPLLEGFGGHALAAGFTIREENIPAFAAAMNDYVCACTGGEEMVSALDIDGELDDVGLLTLEGVEGLELLEPYGAGNPKPVFSLSGCLVSAVNEVGGGRHLKLKLTASGRSFDAIFFSATAEEAGVGPGDRVDVAFTPQINEYRGWRSVQLQLCDLRPALTRAQAERALYEKFRRGEPLTRQEAEALLPSREEFVTLWRYLKGHAGQAPLEATAHRLARSIARSAGRRETVMRTLVCLEVFDERGLIRLEHTTDHLHIALRSVDGKVNLDDSCIMRKLRHIRAEHAMAMHWQ